VTAYGKLPDFVRYGPGAPAPCRKECRVAGPEAASCPAPVGNKDFARDDVHRLIDRVTPCEASGGARPRHHRGGAVRALRDPPRTRLRLSLDDPVRADRVGCKLDVGGSCKEDRLCHGVTQRNCSASVLVTEREENVK